MGSYLANFLTAAQIAARLALPSDNSSFTAQENRNKSSASVLLGPSGSAPVSVSFGEEWCRPRWRQIDEKKRWKINHIIWAQGRRGGVIWSQWCCAFLKKMWHYVSPYITNWENIITSKYNLEQFPFLWDLNIIHLHITCAVMSGQRSAAPSKKAQAGLSTEHRPGAGDFIVTSQLV